MPVALFVGSKVQGLGFRVQGLGFGVWLGFRVLGLGFRGLVALWCLLPFLLVQGLLTK